VASLFIFATILFYWEQFRTVRTAESAFQLIVVNRMGGYQPLGFPVSLALFRFDADGASQALQQRDAFDFGAVCDPQLDNIVFVVGESSRADHWSINGYDRLTNPLLSEVPNVITFSNIISLAPNTVLSWPFLFTIKNPSDSTYWPNKKTFIQAFKEAGYDTYFVSFYIDKNCTRRDPLALITLEAENVINGCANMQQPKDIAMLPAIRRVLSLNGPKLLVVSTQGSHPGFNRTCPLAYNTFQPSVLTEKQSPETYLNGYDNTIVMTDDFLTSIMNMLQGSRSVLFYVSDHGLAVYDGGGRACGQAFIKAEYRPACVVWASNSFLDDAARQARFDLGRQHAGATVTTDYILHSFLDLCGVQTTRLDRSKSLFSDDLVLPQEYRVEDFHGHWRPFADVPISAN
ncbi:MAG TPA: phosphoethanolamine transferase, partial [Verrucomicrobiae bacterium]|nr:phosphoethanolamine transferase [Verrucomicrobiae bacterium]